MRQARYTRICKIWGISGIANLKIEMRQTQWETLKLKMFYHSTEG